MVILDAVYNHSGEVENFLRQFAPTRSMLSVRTLRGATITFREPAVRHFYCENACSWLVAYDFDGLRFDALHEIATGARYLFPGELAGTARAGKPGAAWCWRSYAQRELADP